MVQTDQPSQAEQHNEKIDDKFALKFYFLTQLFRFLGLVAICLGVVGSLYVTVALPVKYSAGEETVIRIFYNAIASFKLYVIIPYVAAAAFFSLWIRERKISKKAIHREHQRLKELEKEKDKNRTSSGLE